MGRAGRRRTGRPERPRPGAAVTVDQARRVVTVRTHRTRREHLAYALKSFQGAGTRLAGIVIHEGPVANGAPAVGRRGIIETPGPTVEAQTRPGGDA